MAGAQVSIRSAQVKSGTRRWSADELRAEIERVDDAILLLEGQRAAGMPGPFVRLADVLRPISLRCLRHYRQRLARAL